MSRREVVLWKNVHPFLQIKDSEVLFGFVRGASLAVAGHRPRCVAAVRMKRFRKQFGIRCFYQCRQPALDGSEFCCFHRPEQKAHEGGEDGE